MQQRTLLVSVSVVLVLGLVARAGEPTGWKASGRNGAVAAGGAPAVEAGVRILQAGGNAADAAAATLFAMMITDYGSCASGGECALLVFEAKTGSRLRRALIDPAKASMTRRPGDPLGLKALKVEARLDQNEKAPSQDTTTCVVADKWGNVVAATPSCNLYGNQPGPSGVTQGTRLSSLNTTPGHPNRIEPGKRPRITLTPTIVVRDGRAVAAVSVAGGDLQDQTTLNALVNYLDFEMFPERAVTAPRFSTSHHEDSFNPAPDRKAAFLQPGGASLQTTVPVETRDELARRGHIVSTTPGPIGNPVMLVIDRETGLIHAAGDPAAKRHAAAVN